MASDRRSFLCVAAWALATMGCSWPNRAPSAVSSDGWFAFKARFFSDDGRIIDSGNRGISHSEGQGYGMLLAVLADDRAAFDAMHGWAEASLLRDDTALFSWRYDPSEDHPVSDPNNASDGDILIAWALLLAGKRWEEKRYLSRSQEIRDAVRANLIVKRHGMTVLLPGLHGFDHADRTILNPSYYIWPALDAFLAEDGGEDWQKLIADGETLMKRARFGALALPTDWVDLLAESKVEPSAGRPPRFGFDAIRVPLYLVLGGRRSFTEDYTRFWTSYLEQGRVIPAWVDVVTGETAPYGLSNGGLALVARVTGQSIVHGDPPAGEDYYSMVLGALSGISVQH